MRAFLLMLAMLSAYSSIAQIQAFDCEKAIKICSKEPVILDYLSGAGQNTSEILATDCYSNDYPETNSAWITWKIQKGGMMEFSIIPANENDDIDFVLYRSSDEPCFGKTEIRCTASGENLGEEEALSSCLGITGLRSGSAGIEFQGCEESDDNFSDAVHTSVGETYIVFINNYSSSSGFAFELKGNFELENDGNCHGELSSTTEGLESGIEISEAFPNPGTSKITSNITIPIQTEGSVTVFNTAGQIKYQANRTFMPGGESISVDISDYTPGVYFLKIKIGESYRLLDFTKQ